MLMSERLKRFIHQESKRKRPRRLAERPLVEQFVTGEILALVFAIGDDTRLRHWIQTVCQSLKRSWTIES